MNKVLKKAIIATALCMLLDVSAFSEDGVLCENEIINDCLQEIKNSKDLTFDWSEAHFVKNAEAAYLYLNDNGIFVDVINNDDKKIGYVIMDLSEVIISFADYEGQEAELNDEMFSIDRDVLDWRLNGEKQEEKLGENDEEADQVEIEDAERDELRSNEYGAFGTNIISGVTHNLQGTTNCIAASAANIVWYYGTNGYSMLIGGNNWGAVKSVMAGAFVAAGGYANNNTPTALGNYLSFNSLPTSYMTANVHWSTSSSYMRNEIDHTRPCMLGFAKGPTSYSPTVGHMTMCHGYTTFSWALYSVLADGHQSYPVYKIWDTVYNDCTICVGMAF